MLAIYQAGFHSLLLPDSSGTPQGQKGIELGQKVAKVNFSLVCLGVFSGKSETKNGKSEIYFGFEDCRASVVALSLGGGGVHRVQAVRSCSLSLGVFRPFLPAFALFPTLLVVHCI